MRMPFLAFRSRKTANKTHRQALLKALLTQYVLVALEPADASCTTLLKSEAGRDERSQRCLDRRNGRSEAGNARPTPQEMLAAGSPVFVEPMNRLAQMASTLPTAPNTPIHILS